MSMRVHFICLVACAGLAPLPAAASSLPGGFTYLVGFDSRDEIPSGIYAGLANPNAGRLTLLFNHHDHFHGMAAKTYTGPAGNPTVIDSSNNRLPETFSGQSPLDLTFGGPLGGGLYSGKLVNNPYDPDPFVDNYSDIRFRSIDLLAGTPPGSPEDILLQSSANRWSGSLTGGDIWIELVSISPGLQVGTATDPLALTTPGDKLQLGGANLAWDPVFWTDGSDPLGTTYSAAFKLVDLSGRWGESGVFYYDFESAAAVPEPGTVVLLGLGLTAVWFGRWRRQPGRALRA